MIKRFFGKVENDKFILSDEDSMHLAVLRFGVGDLFLGICGDEYEYTCQITEISKKCVHSVIISKSLCTQNPKNRITLFQATPKADKLEFITQKITELGATNLVVFDSEYAVAKPNSNKITRLEKITIEACKQCGRSQPVKISGVVEFDNMLEMLETYDIILFAYEKQKDTQDIDLKNYKNIAIIVGSEGGFSPTEVQKIKSHNVKSFGLGSRILRCETAAVMAVGLVSYKIDN